MEIIKIFSVVVLYIFSQSLSESMSPKLTLDLAYSSRTSQAMLEIFQACYGDEKLVVIHSEVGQLILESLVWHKNIAPTIIVNNSVSSIAITNFRRSKSNFFILSANQLEAQLASVKNSSLWNSMASFFILKTTKSCTNAGKILKTMWKFNAITSFLLCSNSESKTMIYTYNPYTNRAPRPWKEDKLLIKRLNDDGWTLFRRDYHQGTICEGLQFDRTKFLNGAGLHITVAKPTLLDYSLFPLLDVLYYNSSLREMFRHDVHVMRALKISLNVTIKLHLVSSAYDYSAAMFNCLVPLVDGGSDVALCLRTPSEIYNFTASYPIRHSKFMIVTQRRGLYTPVEKIRNFYGLVTLVSMVLILAVTFFVVLASDKRRRRRLAFAVFEVLRLLVNTSLHSKIDSLASRIFFIVVFLYFLIIHATFQGHIAAFLTKDQERSNVETLDDLRDARYTAIMTGRDVKFLISDPEIQAKVIYPPVVQCVPKVLQNASIACVGDAMMIFKSALFHNLHYTKVFFGNSRFVYAVRDDWPLKERFDGFLMQLEHSGFAGKWAKEDIEEFNSTVTRIRSRSVVKVRVITLDMLMFDFNILAIGLGFAVFIFLCEMKVGAVKKSVKRVGT